MQKKWEYKLVEQPGTSYPVSIKEFLDTFGNEGWELCCHDYGCFIFKREVINNG